LRHGRAQDGGGVRIGPLGRTQIRNNVIENNAAGFVFDSGRGGGLFIDSSTSDVIVQENDILGNNAGASGGGIFEEITGASNHQIRRNRIKGNGCHFCGGGASLWRASFTYNLVLENSTDTYAGGICSEHADVSNNTVVGNHATVVGGAGIYITGGLAINNIIVGNEPGGIECAEQNEGPPRLECNDSWGNNGSNFLIFGACDSTRNFSFDPVFCDSASADYSIAPNSPCAPDHSGGCDLIGAFPVGAKCRLTPANRITWGKLKTLYR